MCSKNYIQIDLNYEPFESYVICS